MNGNWGKTIVEEKDRTNYKEKRTISSGFSEWIKAETGRNLTCFLEVRSMLMERVATRSDDARHRSQ